jgi:hypothetical protein
VSLGSRADGWASRSYAAWFCCRAAIALRRSACARSSAGLRSARLASACELLHALPCRARSWARRARDNDSVARVVDPSSHFQPWRSPCAVLGDLGKRANRPQSTALLCIRGGALGVSSMIALERFLASRRFSWSCRSPRVPARPGVRGALLGNMLQLMKGFRGPLRVQQGTGIGHADFWRGIAFPGTLADDGFGLRSGRVPSTPAPARPHLHWRIAFPRFASGVQCTCSVAGQHACVRSASRPQPRSRGSSGESASACSTTASRQFLVGAARAMNPRGIEVDDDGAFPAGVSCQPIPKPSAAPTAFGQAVQPIRNLQHKAVGFAGFRVGPAARHAPPAGRLRPARD